MTKSTEIYSRRINRVIDYVNNHLEQTISLEKLAEVACFSPYHFHRIFVAVTGESVNFFTNRVRLEKGARLLKFSTETISEISIQCGFSSPSTFSRAFKQYFELSPRAYRSTGEIENSKICKELFPLEAYLVPMSEAELKANFPVQIKTFPERRIAYIRVAESFKDGVVLKALEKLIAWAKKANLFDSETFFGMSLDDPLVTPQDKYRYEIGLTLPADFRVDSENYIETTTLPECKYAVATVSGSHSFVATGTNYLFSNWLINSEFEPAHQHGMEIFRDNKNICNWDHFDLDLCIPIKNISTY